MVNLKQNRSGNLFGFLVTAWLSAFVSTPFSIDKSLSSMTCVSRTV